MKAPNALIKFFKVPKYSVKNFFCINFYPNVAQRMYDFMHQVSYLTLCFYWMHDFFFVISKDLKDGNFIYSFKEGQKTTKNVTSKVFSGNTQI